MGKHAPKRRFFNEDENDPLINCLIFIIFRLTYIIFPVNSTRSSKYKIIVFFLIDLRSIYYNRSCQRFSGRSLLLFPVCLFIKIFLRIQSSLILSKCAHQFFSTTFDPVIDLLDSTFFPDVFTSLFIKQRKVEDSSKGLHLSCFQHLPSFGCIWFCFGCVRQYWPYVLVL